jgi:hypothetical protein
LKTLGASLLLVALLAPIAFACAEEEKSAKTPTKKGEQVEAKSARDERFDRETPEGTVRSFTLGVMLGNEKLIKLTVLPVSEEDMKYLTKQVNGLKSTPKEFREF